MRPCGLWNMRGQIPAVWGQPQDTRQSAPWRHWVRPKLNARPPGGGQGCCPMGDEPSADLKDLTKVTGPGGEGQEDPALAMGAWLQSAVCSL